MTVGVLHGVIRDARRRQRRRRLGLTALAAGLGAAAWTLWPAGGPAPSSWQTFRADGVSVRYPPGWYATAAPLTHVTWPEQVLAVASYPLPSDNRGDDGCEPAAALARMPPDAAFLYGWSLGDAAAAELGAPKGSFEPQPRQFSLRGFGRYECLGPSYRFAFVSGGRAFQVHVVFGPRASARTRAQALAILDSFRAR